MLPKLVGILPHKIRCETVVNVTLLLAITLIFVDQIVLTYAWDKRTNSLIIVYCTSLSVML